MNGTRKQERKSGGGGGGEGGREKPLTSSASDVVGFSDFLLSRLLDGFPNIPPPGWVPVTSKLSAFPGELIAAIRT